MNKTEYETAQETAERLGVTVRAIQKWAAEGRIPGATRRGRVWMIPKGAEPLGKPQSKSETKSEQPQKNGIPDVYQLTPFRVAMPLLNSAYPIGKCMEYIEAMPDPDDRNIALAEYYFFSGRSDEAARVVAEYQDSHDPSLRFSANLIATFANLAGGHTHLTRFAMGNLLEQVKAGLRSDAPPQLHAIGIFTATTASVLLHLPVPPIPPLEDYMKYLPGGLKLYACYILAHKAYLEGDYSRSLAIADMGLAMCPDTFPIAFVYCHIFAAIALMNLKRTEEAMARLKKAWAIAEPDELLQPFAEHHGLLHGLVERYFKNDYPEEHKKIDRITYAFSAGWRKVHNPDTNHDVADNLTTTEFTVAMLYTRGWSYKEIAGHLQISERSVSTKVSDIFAKTGVNNRTDLKEFMLK